MNLANARILITRPRQGAEEFARALETVGAIPVLLPAVEIGALEDTADLDHALRNLAGYDWLVLTSANGVQAVWERFAALGITSEKNVISPIPTGMRVAAIGPKTAAALTRHAVIPDFVPTEYVAEAILPGLGDLQERRVLLLRADQARPALAEAIREAGGVAHEVPSYRSLLSHPSPTALAALTQRLDILTFTSSSTVRNFTNLARRLGLDPCRMSGDPVFACIGPVTATTAREEGLRVDVIAETYTTEGLIEALKNYHRSL